MPELAPWDASLGPAPRPVAAAVVETLFAERGVTPPPAYVSFVQAHGGEHFRSGANRVTDANGQQVGLGTVYHFDTAQPRYHIADLWEQVADDLEPGLVPIATTDYSGLVCLDYRQAPADPPVVTFDFEAVPDKRITRIAPSFKALLTALDRR